MKIGYVDKQLNKFRVLFRNLAGSSLLDTFAMHEIFE